MLTLTNLAVRSGGYIYRVVMARLLSVYEYGILNLALPLQFLVVLMASSGIAPSIAKFVAEKREEVVGSALVYFTAIALAFSALAALFSPAIAGLFHESGVALPFALAALALPFAAAMAIFTGTMQGRKRMLSLASSLVALQGSRIVFSTALVLVSATAAYAIAGSVLGFFFALLVAFVLFIRLGVRLSAPDFGEFYRVASFSIPVTVTSIGAFALAYIDILAIGVFLSPQEVGVYSAASPTSRLALAFSSALYASVLPSVSEFQGDWGRIKEVVSYSSRVSLLVLLATTALLIAFSEYIILLLFGVEYIEAVEPLRILLIGTFFLGIFTQNSAIFQGLGLPELPMKILLFSALADLTLNILLIPPLGIEGAALSTSISLAFAGVASALLLQRHIRRESS